MPLVSVSDAQRQPIAAANFAKTIYHGLPLDLLAPTYEGRGGYLAFLGRISPEKGPDRAIAIANALGLPLRIAAKVDKVDEAYFREVITPLLGRPGVEFVGEINDCNKAKFLGDALALLFPIDWPEPFGLVMIEAMACGTPVLGFRRGSVPEIIDDHITGRIVDTVDEAIRAAAEVTRLDRRAVRRRFEERFSSQRMANDYVEVYGRLSRGASLSLTTSLRRLDRISSLSTETAERNIVRVEARPQIGEDSVDSIDTIAEAPFYIASTGPSARNLTFDALV